MNDFTLQKGLVLSLLAEQIIAIILSHIYETRPVLFIALTIVVFVLLLEDNDSAFFQPGIMILGYFFYIKKEPA